MRRTDRGSKLHENDWPKRKTVHVDTSATLLDSYAGSYAVDVTFFHRVSICLSRTDVFRSALGSLVAQSPRPNGLGDAGPVPPLANTTSVSLKIVIYPKGSRSPLISF